MTPYFIKCPVDFCVIYLRNLKKQVYMGWLHRVVFHHLLLRPVLRLFPVRDFDRMDSLLVVEMLERHFQIATCLESEFQLASCQRVEQKTAVQWLEVIQHELQVNAKGDDQIDLAERDIDIWKILLRFWSRGSNCLDRESRMINEKSEIGSRIYLTYSSIAHWAFSWIDSIWAGSLNPGASKIQKLRPESWAEKVLGTINLCRTLNTVWTILYWSNKK